LACALRTASRLKLSRPAPPFIEYGAGARTNLAGELGSGGGRGGSRFVDSVCRAVVAGSVA
jgi:hypothetical protein